MRITFNGSLGSGKSTVGRKLAEILKIPFISTGQMFREIGRIQNLDALNTNLAAESNTQIDAQVDGRIQEIDRTVDDFIMDSRMAWHFVHGALNVFLSADAETAAARIVGDTTRATERYASMDEAMASLDSRRASEVSRYSRLYGVDIEAEENFDLYVITDDAAADDIVALILAFLEKKLPQKFWIPKTRVVPMAPLGDAARLAPARPMTFADDGALPLTIEANFGFHAGDAACLLAFMGHESRFLPYRAEAKASSPLRSRAEKTLKLADLKAWEAATGVTLAFARRLDAAGA